MFEDENERKPGDERKLSEGMRALSARTPRAAPPRVRAQLVAAFRAHASRRRRRRYAAWTLATAAVVAMLFVAGFRVRTRPSAPPSSAVGLSGSGTSVTAPRPDVSVLKAPTPRGPGASRERKRLVTPRTEERVTEFVPLPYSNPSLPLDTVGVFRVELPASALRLAGFPVAEERAHGRVTADVVLGQDGQPRAIRFVM